MAGARFILDESSRREFTSALRKYAKKREIDNAEACNRAAYQVAWRAIVHTQHANPSRVESQLGETVGHALTFLKSGKISKSKRSRLAALVSTKSLAYNIVAARLYRKGGQKNMPRSVEIQQQAAAFVRRRLASINFIRSGWIPAIRRLQRFIKQSISLPRSRAGIGGVRIAKQGRNVFAEISNRSVNPKNRTSDDALVRVGGQGLERAVDETRRDMLLYVGQQLEKRAGEFNAAR